MKAQLGHYGLSPVEIEVIYDILKRSFETVDEECVIPDDTQFVSIIEIRFPVPYGESFFEFFPMEKWHNIKSAIKEMRRRRGRKDVRASFHFSETSQTVQPKISFILTSKNHRGFEIGIEKIEYLIDIVPLHLKSLPPHVEEVVYLYDEANFRWYPQVAKTSHNNAGLNSAYHYKNGEWVR